MSAEPRSRRLTRSWRRNDSGEWGCLGDDNGFPAAESPSPTIISTKAARITLLRDGRLETKGTRLLTPFSFDRLPRLSGRCRGRASSLKSPDRDCRVMGDRYLSRLTNTVASQEADKLGVVAKPFHKQGDAA